MQVATRAALVLAMMVVRAMTQGSAEDTRTDPASGNYTANDSPTLIWGAKLVLSTTNLRLSLWLPVALFVVAVIVIGAVALLLVVNSICKNIARPAEVDERTHGMPGSALFQPGLMESCDSQRSSASAACDHCPGTCPVPINETEVPLQPKLERTCTITTTWHHRATPQPQPAPRPDWPRHALQSSTVIHTASAP